RGAADTVGGFVVERLGRLARAGDTVEVDGATLQVSAVERRRVAELLVTRHPLDESGADDERAEGG
ncbi:transporter associated domain-containing protein, partial [uncultured Microbacterium sp.]|uniref:transporter associated domain-containing protein n=1 Tax=uncultured Microbacterium sp. TaxID=191216 RepID=UPI0028D0E5A0